MSRFEIRKKPENGYGADFVQLFDNETGQRATVYLQGSSLQELVLKFNNDLVNVVYGHQDYADFLAELPRLDVPRIEPIEFFERGFSGTASENKSYGDDLVRYMKGMELMRKNPAWAGAAFLDLANRTYKGQGVIIHPDTGAVIKTMNFPVNHETSNSFIHGNGMYRNAFVFHTESNDDYALVTMKQLVGIDLEDFPKGVFNFTTYKLTPAGLIEAGVVWNLGQEYAPITQGRHSSYRIGKEGIEDHALELCTTGSLEVDEVKNPTGRILPHKGEGNVRFDLADEVLDTTFLNIPGRAVYLKNKVSGYGLSLEATDNETRMFTCWTHELPEDKAGDYHRQFAAIEFLAAGHSAMLSLPLQIEQRIIPKELQQRVLAPNEALHYGRRFSPIVYK